MSDKLFAKEEQSILSKNKYVKNVTDRGITYTDDFKRIFIAENQKGLLPREIFHNYGFDINIIGIKRIKAAANRWRTTLNKNGICGLEDGRKYNSGRPSEKELSIEEKYARLKAQNEFLKTENEFLKKLDILERKVIKRK